MKDRPLNPSYIFLLWFNITHVDTLASSQFDDGVRERVVDVCVEMQALVQGLQQRYLAEVRYVLHIYPPPIIMMPYFTAYQTTFSGREYGRFFVMMHREKNVKIAISTPLFPCPLFWPPDATAT
jgi:hypothetical protein